MKRKSWVLSVFVTSMRKSKEYIVDISALFRKLLRSK